MPKLKSHNFTTTLTLSCLLSIFFAFAGNSQTVALKLKNGDRLTGKIISETTNLVTFSTSWAKEISVPVSEIQSREIIPALAATNSAAASTNVAVSTTNTPPPSTNSTTVAKAVPVTTPAKPVEKKAPSSWHGDAQVGADVGISETKRQLYSARFKVTYAPVSEGPPGSAKSIVGRFRNTFEYNGAYGTTDGILSANRMDGSSKTDFDLGKNRRLFVYNLVGAGYDEIRKIQFRYELGPGVGYHMLTRSNLVLNSEIGMNYQVQHLRDTPDNERFYYRLAEDFTWKISKTLTFDEKFELFPKIDLEDFRFRFESNLRYWLLENLSMNLTVLDIYDTQPARHVGRNDLQIRSSIGVKF